MLLMLCLVGLIQYYAAEHVDSSLDGVVLSAVTLRDIEQQTKTTIPVHHVQTKG